MKLPGTYAAYAAIMAIFGETGAGIHLGLMVVNIAATILIFLLAKNLYGSLAGTVAGVTYAFLSCRPGVLGLAGHATHFVVLAALGGILLLVHAIDKQRTFLLFASGLCLGLAYLMKQPGILFSVFAGFYWLWREWKRPMPWRNLALRGGVLLAGIALPFGLTCLLLFRAGVFSNFWFWTWSYARQYASITPLAEGKRLLWATLPWAVRPFAIWEIAAVGLTSPIWSRYARAHGGLVASLVLFSTLAVCPGFYFRPHYYILLLPAAALCTGIGVSAVRQTLLGKRFGIFLAALPLLYFAVTFVMGVRSQYKEFFRLEPVALFRQIYGPVSYPEAVDVSTYIRGHSEPQETVAVFGSEPEIFFYSGRHSATSYLYMNPLVEKQSFAVQMQNHMMEEIQAAQPRFLVYVDAEPTWGGKSTLADNREFLDRLWTYTQRNYKLVNRVRIADDATEHLWADHAYLYFFTRDFFTRDPLTRTEP
jgi:hypothetical protein